MDKIGELVVKSMTLVMLLIGGVLLLPHASAYHDTRTTCDGLVYDPLSGDEVVERCNTRYHYDEGCYKSNYYYTAAGLNIRDRTTYSCNGEYWVCYVNRVYVDTNPVRVGTC